MRLYAGSCENFVSQATRNQIADLLKDEFFKYYRYNPSPNEVQSWRNSLRAVSQVFQVSKFSDQGIILEYQLPLTSRRIDCIVCGVSEESRPNAVLIELKQWESCQPAVGELSVKTWVGGALRDSLHPSVQVGQYKLYLEDNHSAFYDEGNAIGLNACAFLHNYTFGAADELLNPKFGQFRSNFPVFAGNEVDSLSSFLQKQVSRTGGLEVMKRIERSRISPSKKLMQHVAEVIKGRPEYTLLDEQLVVYDRVLGMAKSGLENFPKTVMIVKGGPGTGKSVIAINLLADLLKNDFNAHYATGSKAFTETLRKKIGARGSSQFKYFNSYMNAAANEIDVLIADESHRIRQTSNSRFTPKSKRSDESQVDELLRVSKLSIFFVDDVQVVRPNEIGSSTYIKESAKKFNAEVIEYELEAQFRCSGSDAFVNWINNTLDVQRTANVLWEPNDSFEFRIFDSATSLKEAIEEKSRNGFSARLMAGFCWKWSDPRDDGTLIEDIQIGDFSMPWDAKPGAKGLAENIPSASLWATDPGGINQVGCVYTAQGFEFDYAGVIVGLDLTYSFDGAAWVGNPKASADTMVKRAKENFVDMVKQTYRVLLTRGMKGCYVYFMDKDTERFFRSRMDKLR